MATRMQQRRGTASQWTSANPVLNAGEMGWESDTNKFKMGDGTNHWADLDYFIDANSTVNPAFGTSIVFEGATADSYETTLQVTDPTADRTITFPDATGTVVLADGSGNVTVSGDLTVSGTTTTINSTTINATTGIVFEGATANAFETTLTVADPTADRTITFPDETGSVITTGNFAAITSLSNPSISNPTISGLIISDSSIVLEGATANDFETTLNITDPTADRTITFPDVSGNVITSGNLSDITSLGVLSSVVFEGSTANDFELTLAGGDPTADRTVSFPDAGGVVVVDTATQTLTNKTLTSPEVSGLTLTDASIILEGSSPDNFETTLTVIDPTADRTITFPNATGTVALTSDLSSYAPLNSPTFTGTVTLPANTISQSMMSDDSVGTNEIGGSAVTTAKIADLNVTEGKIADSAITSAKIANGAILNEDINASAAIALSKLATDPLARANHTGTQTASTVSDFDTQVRTSKVTDLAAPTSSFSMNSQKITSLATPTADADAATKAYVDAATSGLNVHAAVQAATTANVTLASALENGDTLDGVTLATGNRVLVKNQTDKTENGIYVVKASGAPDRADDYNAAGEVDAGDFIFVEAGTANGKTGYVQTNVITTVGSDNIEFTQFSGAGTYTAGSALTLTGSTFSIADEAITSAKIANDTIVDADINSAAAIAQSKISGLTTALADKAPLASPTFTGTVTLPAGGIVFSDGTQALEGVPSRTPIIQKTESYTLSALTERDDLIEMSSATGVTLSIPTDATLNFPIGTSIDVLQTGAGQVTIAAVTPGTTTVNATPGLKLRTTWSSATLFKRAANTWVVYGDLTA
jgi:hypothetical protein